MLGTFLPVLPIALLTQPSMACGFTCTNQLSSLISITELSPIERSVASLQSQPLSQNQLQLERSFGPISPSLSSILSSALPPQRTIFEDSFDNDLSNFIVDSGARETHGAVIQADPLTPGYAVRLEVRRDDPISNNKLRSELVPRVERDGFEFGTDYFYQFRMYLPPEWETDDVAEVVAQWHGRPDRDLGEPFRQPPLSLRVDGEVFELVTRSDAAQVNRTNDPGETFTELTAWTGPIERGRWIDWAFHIRWSYDGDGIIRIWKDGQHIHTHRGANTYNDRTPPYFKLGVYKWIWTRNPERSRIDRRVIWLDDISIGILDSMND
ncbi:MAG: polysaccharide lyase [Synechococcus sp.]